MTTGRHLAWVLAGFILAAILTSKPEPTRIELSNNVIIIVDSELHFSTGKPK